MLHPTRFPAAERLKKATQLQQVFAKGSSFACYPMRAVFVSLPAATLSVQVAMSVPKRAFKKATDRHLLQRRMREAYRLRKAVLAATLPPQQLSVVLIFVAKEILPFEVIDKGMAKMLRLLPEKIATNHI